MSLNTGVPNDFTGIPRQDSQSGYIIISDYLFRILELSSFILSEEISYISEVQRKSFVSKALIKITKVPVLSLVGYFCLWPASMWAELWKSFSISRSGTQRCQQVFTATGVKLTETFATFSILRIGNTAKVDGDLRVLIDSNSLWVRSMSWQPRGQTASWNTLNTP